MNAKVLKKTQTPENAKNAKNAKIARISSLLFFSETEREVLCRPENIFEQIYQN